MRTPYGHPAALRHSENDLGRNHEDGPSGGGRLPVVARAVLIGVGELPPSGGRAGHRTTAAPSGGHGMRCGRAERRVEQGVSGHVCAAQIERRGATAAGT